MKRLLQGFKTWLGTMQGKLIIASLLISLVPTALAADMTVRLVQGVMDTDVESFLHETSLLFLSNFKENRLEGAALAHFLYENHTASDPVVRANPAFLRMAETMGYGVIVTYDHNDHTVLYSNYPVRHFEILSNQEGSNLYSLHMANRSPVMTGGVYTYQAGGHQYDILVGNWLDENFIENLRSVTSIDLRLYFRLKNGFRLIYASRTDVQPGTELTGEAAEAMLHGVDSFYDPQAEDGRFRVEYLPVRNASGQVVGVVSAGLRVTEVPAIGDLPVHIIFSVFLSGAVLTALAGLFVTRRLSRPLRSLSKGVRSISEGDYGQRVQVQGKDEVAELAESFNTMAEKLGQLQALEAELRRRDRLSGLGEVAVGIAHEVRNPLGTIKTSAELVRKRDGVAPTDAKLLGYVIDEVRRIDSLIEEFLSFAKPRPPQLRAMRLTTVVERVATFCEPELTRHGVALVVEDDSRGAEILGDEDHLFQACLNLVLNAIDAMKDGGRLLISLRQEQGRLLLAFNDTGLGIPPELQEKIFNPFFTTKPRGTGLGLAKVFSVMESHQGRVDCRSVPGQGSVFTLILPVFMRKGDNAAHHSAG